MDNLTFFQKIQGEKRHSGIPYPKFLEAVVSGAGGMVVIAVLYLLHGELDVFPAFIIPFGASAVLVFAAPSAPFSQPRNVILGHLVAALVGMIVFYFFPVTTWWTLFLANGLAIFFMSLFKAVHPPAGATPLLPIISNISDFTWILAPVLVGSIIVVLVGIIYNNCFKWRRYPVYWY